MLGPKNMDLAGHLTKQALSKAKSNLPKLAGVQNESKYGFILSVSGPIITADIVEAFMYELVRVGAQELIGEIISLSSERATIQVYEETAGLRVGDPVLRTHTPLSIDLGPGILDNIFDQSQRPLETLRRSGSIYIPRDSKVTTLDLNKQWHFIPCNFKIGDSVSGGDLFGTVQENALVVHKILVPPETQGEIVFLKEEGHCTLSDVVLILEFREEKKKYTMVQSWSVRTPRPYAKKLFSNQPLFTGCRAIDSLFPISQGSTCAISSLSLGLVQEHIMENIATYSNSDVLTLVGCGNGINELISDFPYLLVKVNGLQQSVMKKTTVVGAHMPVTIREASIYCGATFAEYFRDQGYNVSLLLDSMSSWAEAVREISAITGDGVSSGYHASVNSRIVSFYERAGTVSCLGSPNREGSVTIIGSVSRPSVNRHNMNDFADTFHTMNLNVVNGFWALEKKIALRSHFPPINWLTSWTRDDEKLEKFHTELHPEFPAFQKTFKNILSQEEKLNQKIQLFGENSIGERDRWTLKIAQLIRNDFLQQNMFSSYDRYCPVFKMVWMMRNIVSYYNLGIEALEQFENLKGAEIWEQVGKMKFMVAKEEDEVVEKMRKLKERIEEVFEDLRYEMRFRERSDD